MRSTTWPKLVLCGVVLWSCACNQRRPARDQAAIPRLQASRRRRGLRTRINRRGQGRNHDEPRQCYDWQHRRNHDEQWRQCHGEHRRNPDEQWRQCHGEHRRKPDEQWRQRREHKFQHRRDIGGQRGSMTSGGVTTSSGGSSGTASTAALVPMVYKIPAKPEIDCGGTCPACPVVYKVNPPNQCQNQYFYPNCKSGDATTQCGGVCQPRNACENAPSKDGKVGFACSRYMLFSPAMLQAAKDDGAQNGWDASAPPFLYAVAGHDTNTGGIDQGMTGSLACCECYQLILRPTLQRRGQNNQARRRGRSLFRPSTLVRPPTASISTWAPAGSGPSMPA